MYAKYGSLPQTGVVYLRKREHAQQREYWIIDQIIKKKLNKAL